MRVQGKEEGRTHPVVVDDLGDDGDTARGGAAVEEDDTADLDEALEVGFLHSDEFVSSLLLYLSCNPSQRPPDRPKVPILSLSILPAPPNPPS